MKAFAAKQQTSASPRRGDASPLRGMERALSSSPEHLDPATAGQMGVHFGHDFSQVRVHQHESALELGADAYTIANDIVFAPGLYDPASGSGWHLLAHELTHVVQQAGRAPAPAGPLFIARSDALEQNAHRAADGAGDLFLTEGSISPLGVRTLAARPSVGTADGVMVQRQAAGKAKPKAGTVKPKAPAKKPEIHWVYGNATFTKRARDAVLHGGALLPGEDNAHIVLRDDGLLGYDPDYANPSDPFRWEKMKFIVDSGAKVRVDKVSITDEFDTLLVGNGEPKKLRRSLIQIPAEGLTLTTVAIQRALQPQGILMASAESDTNQVFFSTQLSDPSSSSLAHELFGHLYLALKGVPFQHPNKPEDIKTRGTLSGKHGIKDPLGGTYTGTVQDYIDQYVGSSTFSALKSPTQFVSRNQLRSALNSFKKDFGAGAQGKLNGDWSVPPSLDLSWEIIGANYTVAETADPALVTSIEDELATWYGTLTVDQQYVFMSYLITLLNEMLRKTKLASTLRTKIKPPAGMRFREP